MDAHRFRERILLEMDSDRELDVSVCLTSKSARAYFDSNKLNPDLPWIYDKFVSLVSTTIHDCGVGPNLKERRKNPRFGNVLVHGTPSTLSSFIAELETALKSVFQPTLHVDYSRADATVEIHGTRHHREAEFKT